MLDYPSADAGNHLILRVLGWFYGDWALVMNMFYLLGFPLAAISALYAIRRLGITDALSASLAILFAFTP